MARRVEDDDIGPRADRQAADVVTSQCCRATGRRGPHRLRGGKPHLPDRHGDAERHAGRVARARVAVRGERHRDAGIEHAPAVGVRRARRELRSGQQRRDRAASAEQPEVGLRRERAVVRRRGPCLDSDPDAVTVLQLVGVHPRHQAAGSPGGQDGPRLIGVEGAPVAEDVHPPRVRSARRQHRTGDEVDVPGGVVGVLRRDDVRAEKRGLGRHLPRQAKAALLIGDGLHLERRRAAAPQLGGESAEVRAQDVVVGGPGAGDGVLDAAGRVGLAGHPRRELLRTVAREHQVRVAVHEAREHRGAVDRDRRVRRRAARHRSHPDDPSAVHHERGVAHEAERARARGGIVGDELGDPGDRRRARAEGSEPLPGHAPSRIGMRTPRSSATSAACS